MARRLPIALLLVWTTLTGCNDVGTEPVGRAGASGATGSTVGTGASGATGSTTGTGGSGGGAGSESTDGGLEDALSPEAADAPDEATSDGSETSVRSFESEALAIFAAKSADCAACATARCGNSIVACSTRSGKASKGLAAGTPKNELCVETLACVVPTGCASISGPVCYCAVIQPDPLFHCPKEKSPCATALERSLEVDDPVDVIAALADESKGGTWAMDVMQCLRDQHCASCLEVPPPDGGEVDSGDEEGSPGQ